MATANRMRALNRLPYDFEDGLKIAGVDVTTLNQISTANGAGLVGFAPVGGLSSNNVQSAIAELDTEKVGKTELADTEGAALVGYDSINARTVFDNARPIADYTALRAYAGRAAQVRITSTGIAGFFYYDASDTTSLDNGGTIIVSANGRRWKRIFNGAIHVRWFGANLNGIVDDRAAFVSADSAAISSKLPLFIDGVAHIGTALSLSSPLVDTGCQMFTQTSQVTVANKDDVRPEWWGAKQNTESTIAINRAIRSITNGAVLNLSGFYYVSGTGTECVLVDRPLTIKGIGAVRSGFIVLSGGISANTDVVRISPDMTKSDGEGYSLFDLSIQRTDSAEGRHSLNLDISLAGQRLKNLYIHRCIFTRGGGKGIYVTNPIPNTDSVFTTSIRDCVVYNGIYLINAGDSIRIEDCTLTGNNYAVWLQLISGANAPLISGCNITSKSGAVYCYGPTNPCIVYNNIEAISLNDTPESAMIVLTGENSGIGPLVSPPRKAIIRGNIFGMLADGAVPRVTRAVYMYQGDGVVICDNQFNRAVPASQIAYLIGDLCRYNFVYGNTISGATNQEGYTDLGRGTSGTVRTLSAYNTGYQFYTSSGNWQSPRYIKDTSQVVTLSGAIALDGGTWTDGATVFTLPLGYRPRLMKTFPVSAFQTSVGYIAAFMQIDGNGNVSLRGVTGKSLDWVNYDNVSFMSYEA